jgi:hypothetical protein
MDMTRMGEYCTIGATVEHVTPTSLRVRMDLPGTPASCGGCSACVSGGRKPVALDVPYAGTPLNPGDRVRVRHFRMNQALAAVLVFGLPVACLTLGIASAPLFLHSSADSPTAALCGGAGLVLGAAAAWLSERLLRAAVPACLA